MAAAAAASATASTGKRRNCTPPVSPLQRRQARTARAGVATNGAPPPMTTRRRLSGAAPPETEGTTLAALQLRGPVDLRVAERASSRQMSQCRRRWRRQRPRTSVLLNADPSASSFDSSSHKACFHAALHESCEGSCSPRVRARSWAIAIARTCTDDGLKPMPRCLSSSSLRVVSTKCSGGSEGAPADALGWVRA